MPEEVTSVILGSPGEFKAEHNEGEPEYVYVKPITKQAAQSNLLIATRSGQHVTLELVSDGTGIPNQSQPVDFLIEYRSARSFLISSDSGTPATPAAPGKVPAHEINSADAGSGSAPLSSLDEEFKQQQKVNAPKWTKWEDKQIETSIGDLRQWSNETAISYSILNSSDQPVEIVPPQIQITGRSAPKKKKKEGKGIISDQLEIRDYAPPVLHRRKLCWFARMRCTVQSKLEAQQASRRRKAGLSRAYETLWSVKERVGYARPHRQRSSRIAGTELF